MAVMTVETPTRGACEVAGAGFEYEDAREGSAVSATSSSVHPQRQDGTFLGTRRPHSGHTRLKSVIEKVTRTRDLEGTISVLQLGRATLTSPGDASEGRPDAG